MATLINGDGNQAVYAAQDADLLSGAITNNKTVILDVGEKFSADVLSSSVIEVHDGVILTKEGRRIQLDQNAVDLFEFPAGAQGVVSWYYIGYKLEIDEDSHQICSTFVQKMDSEGDTIPEGSFRDGDQEVYISLYHVQQDTLGVLTPTLVLTENMTMIDVLDNLIGSASDLPDPTKTVTKNIDQINSDLTVKTINTGIIGLQAHKSGHIITLDYEYTYSSIPSGYQNLGVLPEEIRPLFKIRGIGVMVRASTDRGYVRIEISESTGIISYLASNSYSDATQMEFTITFVR